MSLSDAKIRTLKPSDKPFKVSDSHGLYLLVKPGGSRHWYLKYRINSKESRIALGAYPAVSLSDARQQREGIRRMLALNTVVYVHSTCSLTRGPADPVRRYPGRWDVMVQVLQRYSRI